MLLSLVWPHRSPGNNRQMISTFCWITDYRLILRVSFLRGLLLWSFSLFIFLTIFARWVSSRNSPFLCGLAWWRLRIVCFCWSFGSISECFYHWTLRVDFCGWCCCLWCWGIWRWHVICWLEWPWQARCLFWLVRIRFRWSSRQSIVNYINIYHTSILFT